MPVNRTQVHRSAERMLELLSDTQVQMPGEVHGHASLQGSLLCSHDASKPSISCWRSCSAADSSADCWPASVLHCRLQRDNPGTRSAACLQGSADRLDL